MKQRLMLKKMSQWLRMVSLCGAMVCATSIWAQDATDNEAKDMGVWLDAEADINLSKKWELNVGAGLRTCDVMSQFDRWHAGLGAEFKPISLLGIALGWQIIDNHEESYVTQKGNTVEDYWRLRNRFWGQASLKFKPSILRIGLRFRYQLTHKSRVSIKKFDEEGVRKSNEVKEADNESLLRSRLSLAFKTKTILTPEVSYELFNNLGDGFCLDKQRLKLGTEIKLNKHNRIGIGYVRNIYNGGDDEDKTHNAMNVEYKIKF